MRRRARWEWAWRLAGLRCRRKSRAKARPLQNLGRRLQVRAESQQTAIAILHHELPLVPWHVAKSASEFYALGGVLGKNSGEWPATAGRRVARKRKAGPDFCLLLYD